ncbi:hypothetical protein [Pelagibacterium luteolum]|uniref:hypothetical protein n=1 Tax=Pelagibacterium luteolum TaxID=440168 RepID=UPI000B881A96|nr:hypothetical protein [Pelagibacterium luteolum]
MIVTAGYVRYKTGVAAIFDRYKVFDDINGDACRDIVASHRSVGGAEIDVTGCLKEPLIRLVWQVKRCPEYWPNLRATSDQQLS